MDNPASDPPTLLVIDIINAEGLVIMQTVWATTADRRRGRRRTDHEMIANEAALLARLAELAPQLFSAR